MALDPVLYWNSVALEAHRRDYTFDDAFGDDEAGTAMDRQSLEPQQGGPTRTSRALAIVHLAIFDAFHAVKPIAVGGRTVSPYLPNLPAPPVPASLDAAFADAAVAGAASVTIQHLFGGRTVDPALKEFELSHLQQGTSLASLKGGLEFGAIVGRLHLDCPRERQVRQARRNIAKSGLSRARHQRSLSPGPLRGENGPAGPRPLLGRGHAVRRLSERRHHHLVPAAPGADGHRRLSQRRRGLDRRARRGPEGGGRSAIARRDAHGRADADRHLLGL